MQLVVVMAVRKAVSAATITFTATSMTPMYVYYIHNRPGIRERVYALHDAARWWYEYRKEYI